MHRTLVFDLETTGLSVANADIISLAVRVLETDQSFHELVRPSRLPLPRQITRVTGITTEELRRKSRWTTVGKRVCWWLTHTVLRRRTDTKITLVGHNCRRFDIPILVRHLKLLNPIAPIVVDRCTVVDTLRLLRRSFPQLKNHKQGTVYRHLFQTPQPNAHSAIGDVDALARILRDSRSNFYDDAVKDVRYDIWEHHDLSECEHVFLAGRARDIRAFVVAERTNEASNKMEGVTADPACSSIRCRDCRVVYSAWFFHECSPCL